MPKKAKKPCAFPGCKELVLDGRFCLRHQSENKKQRADYLKHYDEYQRDQRSAKFYRSRAWQAARLRVLIRDNYLCQDCLQESRIAQADTVHHRIELSEDWSKRLVVDNLVSLCRNCHAKRHSRG